MLHAWPLLSFCTSIMALAKAFADTPAASTFTGGTAEPEYADVDTGPGNEPAIEQPGDDDTVVEAAAEPEPVAEEVPAVEEVAEAEPEPSSDDTVVFDADTLKEAKDIYEWDEEFAKGFGTPENLRRAMAAADKRTSQLIRGSQPQQTQEPAAPAATPVTQQQVAAAKAAVEKFNLELNESDYDESLVKQLRAMNEHYNTLANSHASQLQQEQAQRAALEEQFNQITSANQAAEAARFEQEVETSFASLGDGYSELFGKGSIRQLPPNSPQFINRLKVAEEMNILRFADAQKNRQSTNAELHKRAINSLFPDQIKTHARKEIESEIGKRQKQAIARPAGRQPRAPYGEQQAIKRIAEKMAAAGLNAPDFYAAEGL